MGVRGRVVCVLGFYCCCFSSCVSLTNKKYSANLVLGLKLKQVQRRVIWTLGMKSLADLRRLRYSDIFRAAKPRLKINKTADKKYIKGNKNSLESRRVFLKWREERCITHLMA